MIDNRKRTTLKALSGVTAASVIPASVSAASALLGNEKTSASVSARGHDISVSMVSGHGRWHSVVLKNASDDSVSVKHVYPGLVSVDDKQFDINSLFRAGEIHLGPGESYSGVLAVQDRSTVEAELPGGLTRMSSLELATSYQHFGKTMPVVTTRSFFA